MISPQSPRDSETKLPPQSSPPQSPTQSHTQTPSQNPAAQDSSFESNAVYLTSMNSSDSTTPSEEQVEDQCSSPHLPSDYGSVVESENDDAKIVEQQQRDIHGRDDGENVGVEKLEEGKSDKDEMEEIEKNDKTEDKSLHSNCSSIIVKKDDENDNDEHQPLLLLQQGPPITINTADAGILSPLPTETDGGPPLGSADLKSFTMSNSSMRQLFRDELLNTAFMFIKPHANTERTREFVRETILDQINPFDDEHGRIVLEYDISSEQNKNGTLVDKQYKTLARYAAGVRGVVSAKAKIKPGKFKKTFGEDLEKVLEEKRIYNALEALSSCACTPGLLHELWVQAEDFEPASMKKVVKFGKDYYCANLLIHGKNVYVINGFYMAMRESYVKGRNSIHAFVIQWDASSLHWRDFREKVIGATNPTIAEEGSLRKLIYERYQEFEIEERPNTMNNAIHASASPLEALAEQCIWLEHDIQSIDYGRLLLGRGVPQSVILDWCHDFEVKVPNKSSSKAPKSSNKSIDRIEDYHYETSFELVENMNSKECGDKLVGIYDFELYSSVVKPKCCFSRCR